MSATFERINLLPNASSARKWTDIMRALKDLMSPIKLRDAVAAAMNHIDACYAEIDNLRTSALVWNTITDDPKSFPEPMKHVLLDVGLRILDYGYLDDDEFDPPMWNAFGGIYPIEIGHRWACIPETKKAEEVTNG